MSIHTILGSGGVIANGLSKQLILKGEEVRLVSRNPVPLPGATHYKADMTDPSQALEAIKGSGIVYCCIGLPYSFPVWRQQWPRIMDNIIEGCKQANAKLIFFDNVYMYGLVDGGMTEETPYDPCSRKGDLRARIATRLMSEVRKGNITASIARAADFYGPGADKTSVFNLLVQQKLVSGKKPQWLVNAGVRHSFTYTEDAVKAMYLLAKDDNSWNQVWHLPTAENPLTGAELIALAAREMDRPAAFSVLPKWMIRLGGLMDRTTGEMYEMLYQYKYDYLFDSSKFEQAYQFEPTSYEEGIKATLNVMRVI